MKKYDDFLISPLEKMEEIAKAYQSEIQKRQDEVVEEFENCEKFCLLKKNIYTLENILKNLQKYCGNRFYFGKKSNIENILQKFENLPKTKGEEPYSKNYCEAIYIGQKYLSKSLCLGLDILKENNNINIHQKILYILKELSLLVPLISNLLGECRYRR